MPLQFLKLSQRRGASWAAERLTLAQVMISWFMNSSPASGSLLSAPKLLAQSLLWIFCPPHLLPTRACVCVCVCVCFKDGHLGGSAGWMSGFGSGHDLLVLEFKTHIGLHADSSEPGACFGFCVSFALCPSPICVLSLSLKNKQTLKKKKRKSFSQSSLDMVKCTLPLPKGQYLSLASFFTK